EDAYLGTLEAEAEVAEREEALVTVGLEPPYPSTAFGYIKGHSGSGKSAVAVYRVERFVEKPDLERARGFLREGGYYWHLGLFAFRLDVLRQELRRHLPALLQQMERYGAAVERGDLEAANREYEALPAQAIDYALLE